MDVLERELTEFASAAVPPTPTLDSLRRRRLQLRRRRRTRRLSAGTALLAIVAMTGFLVAKPATDSTIVADDGQSGVTTDTTDSSLDSTANDPTMSVADAQSVLQRLHDYHAPPGSEIGDANENVDRGQLLDRLGLADSVSLALGDQVAAVRTRDELAQDDAWHIPLDGYRGRDGVYAFDLFFENTRPDEYTVQVGDYDRCGVGSRPPGLAGAERISAQPAPDVPCSVDWWTVDIYTDRDGQIVALSTSWAE